MSKDRTVRPMNRAPSGGSTTIKVVRAGLLASLAVSALAACGGGGGGATPSPPILPPPPAPAPPPPPPPPPSLPAAFFETPEYFGSGFTGTDRSGLAQIHASSAYAAGATGQGIKVAVIDSGVDPTITELSGQVSGSFDIFAATRTSADTDTDGHGTLVSSVIAAKKDNRGIHGVAFSANILSIRTDTPLSCQVTTGPNKGCSFDDRDIATAVNYAVAQGAKVINISLGGVGGVTTALRNAMIAAANAGVLIAISAGNDGAPASGSTPAQGASPTSPASIAGDPLLLGRVVAVGSVTPQGKISSFSNRAGAATKNFYLLAPGEKIITAGLNNQYFGVSGTSFASPHVAGAMALMIQLFPNLSATAALQALLMTADDYVDPAIDPIEGVAAGAGADNVSGVGIMNLQRAFAPIGTASLSIGAAKVPLGAALAPARGALGDWVQNSGAFNGLVFQDVLNRGFRIDDSHQAAASAPFADLDTRARYARAQARSVSLGAASFSWFSPPARTYDPRTPWADEPEATFEARVNFDGGEFATGRGGGPQRLVPGLTLMQDPSGPATLDSGASWASVAHAFGPVTLDLRSATGAQRSSSGVGVSRSGPDWATRIGFTSMTDATSALGGTLQSRFGDGQDGAHMSAVSFENTRAFGAWQLSTSFEAAAVTVDRINVGGLWTSAWSLSAQHRFAGGDLGFTVAQPRRAEGGSISFSGPVEVTKSGALVFESRIAGLTPSGRETDFETAWRRQLDQATTIEAAAALSLEPNHVASAAPATALWVSLRHLW